MNTSNFLLIAAIPVNEFTDRNFQEFYGSYNQPYFSPMYPIPSEWVKQAEQWLLARQRADPRIYSDYALSDMGCLPNAFIKTIIEITRWKEENGITVPQKYGEIIYGGI